MAAKIFSPAPLSPETSTGSILDVHEKLRFVDSYNRSAFVFTHALGDRFCFDTANLIALSTRLPAAYFSSSRGAVADGWGRSGETGRTLPETLDTMRETNSLVLLKGLADDPEFGQIFGRVLHELCEHVGELLRDDISKARATLVVSSPRRVTPYHIDAETNFLLQLRGEKLVSVFDGHDRSLLTDAELEAFYTGDASAAQYQRERQQEAGVFRLGPGMGLHIPLHAPHWVENGDDVSVALSINCSLRSNDKMSNLYKVNAALRKRGLRPMAPGVSAWRDGLKLMAAGAYGLARGKRARGHRSMNE